MDYDRQRLCLERQKFAENSLERQVLVCFNIQPTQIGRSFDSLRYLNYNDVDDMATYRNAVYRDYYKLRQTLGFLQADVADVIYNNCWKLFSGQFKGIRLNPHQKRQVEKDRREVQLARYEFVYRKRVA